MNFVIIFVALLLDLVMRPFERLRLHRWYEKPLRGWAETMGNTGEPLQALAALLPSFALAFIAGAIAWGLVRLHPVIGFAYGVVVLVLCLGPRNLTVEASAYLKARAAGDSTLAREIAGALLEREPPEAMNNHSDLVAEAVLERAGDYLFSVLFWFALLGPLGAVLYRAADTLAVRAAADRPGTVYARVALRLALVMAWLPLHLLALTYAVAGNFDEAMRDIRSAWSETGRHFLDRGNAVLARAGRGALRGIAGGNADEVEMMHAAVDLIWRSVIIWLTIIGIITLLGWLF